MNIKKAYYVKSAVNPEDYPKDSKPHVVLVGKSNVGKSSFINCIANNKKLAHTSGQPGKTRTVNFYMIDDKFYIVDLPGYGYAKVSKQEQLDWGNMIDTYLHYNANIALILHVLDIRHAPTQLDIQMAEWIQFYGLPVVGIATKSDKIGKTRWKPQVELIRRKLGWSQFIPIIPFSAITSQGKDRVLELMDISINNYYDDL